MATHILAFVGWLGCTMCLEPPPPEEPEPGDDGDDGSGIDCRLPAYIVEDARPEDDARR